ncbi:50S ribosomal protein L1 [Candidatus Peregrinibacteria bacterium HGW-Peregrinibacteria-1]|nr:MAG: 50S ribosomal protein L1 [Candidatus Peregrinibacteria bacterium HGW-Peregrinibacteria-1]
MMKHGKKYNEAKALLEKEFYSFDEAVELMVKTATTKFDSSCEAHLNLGVDPRQADQNIRTTTSLPNGTGREVRVVAFVGEDKVKEAKDAGAIEAGTEELVKKIDQGWLEFDVAVATPDQMKNLAKVAKTLGQKRLMPSPKAGTVTVDFAKTIQELKKGKVELRVDKQGNLHVMFGKVSFGAEKLRENFVTIMKAVMEVKPSSSKGSYVRSVTLTTTMGPGVKVETASALQIAK